MREIRKSGSMRGSGRKALLRKRRLSLSTLPGLKIWVLSSGYRREPGSFDDERNTLKVLECVDWCPIPRPCNQQYLD
jgi:hypothetical protein